MTDRSEPSAERLRYERERRWLQIGLLAVVPFPLGLGGITVLTGLRGFWLAFGLDGEPPDEPTLDSAVRFLAANFFGMGLLVIWAVRKIEVRTTPIRIFVLAAVVGATGRILSHIVVGAPNTLTNLLIGIELGVVGFGLWQARIAKWHARLLG